MKTVIKIMALLLFYSTIQGQNLLLNPGFEVDSYEWGIASAHGMPGVISVDYIDKHEGLRSLVLHPQTGDSAYLFQKVPVTAGHRYLFTYWVKADSMEHYLLPFVRYCNGATPVYDSYFCPNGNLHNWTRMVNRILVPENTDSVLLFFGLFGKGYMHFDEFSLVELSDTSYTSFSVDISLNPGPFKELFSANGTGPGNPAAPTNYIDKFQEIGVDYLRTHDFAIAFDHSVVFPDTSADPLNPASYNFHSTDSCVEDIIGAGGKVYFRFGQSYEINHEHAVPPVNPEKWAQVCLQMIKHYNDGWANGFHYNLDYFEIWNEPDLQDFWAGTVDEYIRLYRLTSEKIKEYNPQLKVGGPTISNIFNESFINVFLDSVETYNLPLDFFAYHLYYLPNPWYFKYANEYVRQKLTDHGLGSVELINSEWNSYMFSFETYSEWGMDDPYNAASAAGAIKYMQESTIGKFFRYSFVNYWFGMVDWNDEYRYSGLAMRAIRQMMNAGEQLHTAGSDTLGTVIMASENEIIVADNSSTASGYSISFTGMDPYTSAFYTIYRIDSANRYEVADTGHVYPGSPLITTGVKSPFLDHIVIQWLTDGVADIVGSAGSVFPNPAESEVTVKFACKWQRGGVIHVSDVAGRDVLECSVTPGSEAANLNTAKLAPGTYIIECIPAAGVKYFTKFVRK